MAKILVVDDTEDLRDLFSLILRRCGHEVQTASSRYTMNSVLTLFIPDLILLDVMLNGEDGRDICKENKANSNTPILLISANPALLKNSIEFGADAFLEKPFDNLSLVGKINTLLN